MYFELRWWKKCIIDGQKKLMHRTSFSCKSGYNSAKSTQAIVILTNTDVWKKIHLSKKNNSLKVSKRIAPFSREKHSAFKVKFRICCRKRSPRNFSKQIKAKTRKNRTVQNVPTNGWVTKRRDIFAVYISFYACSHFGYFFFCLSNETRKHTHKMIIADVKNCL